MKKTTTILSARFLTVAFVAPAVVPVDKKKKKGPTAARVPKSIELNATL
jgi:hypothetical protein